ncbi:MAG TPA: hypothetical protein PKW80_06220 [Bacteroidales bacterium]|nr:hypothetical protein [Bacteroidales bacterium]
MKKISVLTILLFVSYVLSCTTEAQVLKPVITFEENPLTHNVHIASDGQYYYAVNGGKADKGQINKFDFAGKQIGSYEIKLDMRSIMYNKKDKKLYVCTYEREIYCINNLQQSSYEKINGDIYENEQANLAMSEDGKYIYYMSDGTLKIYKFPSGKLSKEIKGLDCGKSFTTGSACVAVDDEHIYTWNSDYKMIFVYDMKGNKVKSVEIEKGSYGFSLSYANGLIFVSDDGDYDIGTWYGYELWGK